MLTSPTCGSSDSKEPASRRTTIASHTSQEICRESGGPGDYHPFLSPDYWPIGAPQKETLEAFVLALAAVGYAPCADGELEIGFEKAALYALGDEIRHAALQQEDGTWKSKLASDEDIRHALSGLEGPAYGKVIAFLKRPRKA